MPANVFLTAQWITLPQARQIASAALNYAQKQNMNPITVTVLDHGGHMITCDRADGCAMLRLSVSQGKAKAALGYGVSSGTIGERNRERPAFLSSVAAASGGEFVAVAGGVLILDDSDRVIGAVGISGDSSDNDERAAIAAIETAGLKPGLAPER